MTTLLRIEAPDFLLTTDIAGHNGEGEYAIVKMTASQLQALRYLLTDSPIWTPEKPTKPGFYWNIGFKGALPEIVELKSNGEFWAIGSYEGWQARDGDLWAGPLTPPEEEK